MERFSILSSAIFSVNSVPQTPHATRPRRADMVETAKAEKNKIPKGLEGSHGDRPLFQATRDEGIAGVPSTWNSPNSRLTVPTVLILTASCLSCRIFWGTKGPKNFFR